MVFGVARAGAQRGLAAIALPRRKKNCVHNPTTATLSMEAIRLLCEADALALWVRDRDTLAKAEGGRNGSWRVAPVSTQPDVECRAVKRCRALLEYRVLEGLSVCQ